MEAWAGKRGKLGDGGGVVPLSRSAPIAGTGGIRTMTMEPRDAAEAIERQRRQQQEAIEELRVIFANEEGWRRLASGSFSRDIWGARAVIASTPSQGFLCNIRVGPALSRPRRWTRLTRPWSTSTASATN